MDFSAPGEPSAEKSRTLLADRDRQPENRENWRSVIGESGSPFYLSIAAVRAWMAASRAASNLGRRSNRKMPFCSWNTSVSWV